MKNPILLICCLIIFTSCIGQQATEISPSAKKAFAQKYPDEDSPQWGIDDHGNFEAHFKKSGEKYRSDFSSTDGSWIETEASIKYDDLPEAVKEAIKSDYDKDDITEIESVEHHKKGFFYDVEFKQKGKNHDVEFNPYGVIIGEEN